MRDELNVVCRKSLQLGAVLGLTFAVCSQAFALKAGHGHVDSLPGAPLKVSIPLLEVLGADVSALRVKVAPADAWAKSGLTPPVSLDSMTVSIEAGFVKDSRMLVLRSNQLADKQIIDVLLEVSSSSGTTQIQSSFLVLTRANEGASAGTVLVKAGDTLSGIALANPVAGADLYQMLWALYQANPQAFFSQNMNMLKAGVTLKLPDGQTVRAIDPKLARDMYQAHLNAFKALRGTANATNITSRAPTPVAPPPSGAQSTSVTTVSAAPTPTGTDRVLLTSASTPEQREDARVSAAKEIAEIQSRVDSLQENVKQLKDALSQTPTGAAASSTNATGSASAVGIPGATGATGASSAGAAGSTGTAGATGTAGVTGTAGATGAAGTAGATGTAGTAGATGTAGTSGAAVTPGATGNTGSAGVAGASSASSTAAGTTSANGTSANTVTGALSQLWSSFTSSALGVTTAILAIGGLLVAWLLRRAGARREVDEVEGDELPEPLNPLTRTALDQKLQGIDLNLDQTTAAEKKEPSIVQPNVSPKA
jgi:pilus assembly protein FimV